MRRSAGAAILVALLAFSTGPRVAEARGGFVLDVGKTGAISGPYTDGGLSLGLGLLWPVDEAPWNLPVRFGLMGVFDDMGAQVEPLIGGAGNVIGLAETQHQDVLGAAFRLDWEPVLTWKWRPYGSGTWGYYRVTNDVRGATTGGVSAPGFSLGAGVVRYLASGSSFGAVVRYHRLFDDETGRYVSAGVEWGWRGRGAR
jgi:hypothetical protein